MGTENSNYVYAYLDPRSLGPVIYGNHTFSKVPYYIGLSKLDHRKFSHLNTALDSDKKCLKTNLIRKLIKLFGEDAVRENIIVVKDNLTHEESCELEIELIKLIGRRDLNQGPLVNHTAGGDGGVDLSGEALYRRNRNIAKSLIGARSCYSYTPEESARLNSESMTKWFDQNRNKTLDDLPKLVYRRYYSQTTHLRSGSNNGMTKFYYIVVSPDGGYHIASRGCLRKLASKLNIPYTTLEISARQNEERKDGKFTRIMRSSGIGHFSFRCKSLKESPIDISMGNQQPRPRLPG